METKPDLITTQANPTRRKNNALLRTFQLMILFLMAPAPVVFGLNFNVPLYSLTNHNTSACSNYSFHFGGLVSQNFGATSVVDTNLDAININSNLVDKSLNSVTPGHVSHVDVHTLVPSRPDLRWFANGTCWWGEGPSHHIDNGTTNTTAAYAAAMVSDLEARGFDGLIFSWYGKGDQTDVVAQNVRNYLNSTNNTNPNFTFTIMVVFGNFQGGETTNNLVNNILYCETNYFNDAHYEKEKGHPLLMFFNVCSAYFSDSQMTTMKSQTSPNTYWVQEDTGHIGQSWVNMTYLWADTYDVGNTNWLATNPYNLNAVTNEYSTIKNNPAKQAYGAMCAHFNGTLTKTIPWSLGKYLPSGNGLCEYYRAQEINQVIPTNMTRMQWATWSDYEEGTEIETATENYFALTTSMMSSNVLSWTITSGDERTVDHYEVYALTNGGNAAFLCSVPSGTHQSNIGQLGLVPGNYQLYVDAIGLPCIRDHLSAPVAYGGQPQNLPSPWVSQDIGSVGVSGSAGYTNGTFTVSGSGVDIWSTSDSFQYVYQSWTGDGQIVARVVSMQNTSSSAKAGLMFRETLNPGSAEGDLFVTPSSGISMQGRTVANASASNVNTTNGITAPWWLKLQRTGNVLSGYQSPDGVNWTLLGTNVYSMTNSIYVGLCVTSKSNSVLNTSVFDNVTISSNSYYNYTVGWPNPSSIVYGTALGAGQNNATSSVAGTFAYSPPNGIVLPAGTNLLTTVFTPTSTNYLGTNLSATLVVTPAPLAITADSMDKVYNTTLTLGAGQTAFTSAGLVLGQAVGSVTLTSSGAVNTAPVGSYPIVPSSAAGGTFNPANYSITYDNGTLTVYQPQDLPLPWTNQDIGSVGVSGSASYTNGIFTVSGSGVDIWSTSDSYQYVYQPWNGDGEIVARVISVQNTAPSAKAGLMYRETLNSGSAEGDIFVTPTSGVSMQGRTVANASASNVNTTNGITAPWWLKLQRMGNVLSGYQSPDGVNWTLVGTNAYSMTNSIYVGLCVTSKSNVVLNTSIFDSVTVEGAWLNQDIGTVGVPGSSQINYSNGVFTVSGSGTDIWGSSDAFQYLYQTVSGDSAIIARVTDVQGTSPWAKAAVMIRETLATNSRNSILFLSPSNGVQLQGRTSTGGSTVSIVNVTNLVAPQWIQLVRSSQNMNAYISADGLNWSWIGTQTNPIATSYTIGLAVSSKNNATNNTSTFDNVSVQNAWTSDDIGNVGVPGDAAIDNSNGTNSIFTVSGSGQDIWSTNDAFQFVGQPLYGNGQIVARVLNVQNTDPWAKAGVMIRDTTAADAINALLFLAPASTNGVSFQGRSVTGGTTGTFLSVNGISAPYWLKLARSGSTFTAYKSNDGSSWTQVGSAQTMTISTNAWIGLAVGSKNNTILNTSTFDNVTITPAP